MHSLYDAFGKKVSRLDDDEDMAFYETVSVEYGRYAPANTNYIVTRVFKKRPDGTYQFPFVRDMYRYKSPEQNASNERSAYGLALEEGWYLVINAGLWEGLSIENGILINDEAAEQHAGAMPLTIDSNGDLGYTDANTTGKGQSLINNGIVSAICGFYPIINNYENFDYPTGVGNSVGQTRAQRNVIGQFENGDYCIITGEGRGFANSDGFTMSDLQTICKGLGLRFAYNLDGGGSTQAVLGLKNLNHVYEGTTGRILGSCIVFNGTNTFSIPNQS